MLLSSQKKELVMENQITDPISVINANAFLLRSNEVFSSKLNELATEILAYKTDLLYKIDYS